MELKGQRRLPTDRATAWAALNNVEILERAVPGCESMTASGDDRYDLAMKVAVGPVRARFKGRMELADIEAPERYTLKFEGAGGAAGFARGDARVTLTEIDAGETELEYVANAQVGGKLAQIGSRLIDAAAAAMADQFFEAFAAELEARQVPSEGAPPAKLGFWRLLGAFVRRLFGASQ